jgi:ferric-dicitrate binding protein FerR (iron transport regulator)
MVTKKESNRISKAVQTIIDAGGSVRHSNTVAQSGGELATLVKESGDWDEDGAEFLVMNLEQVAETIQRCQDVYGAGNKRCRVTVKLNPGRALLDLHWNES